MKTAEEREHLLTAQRGIYLREAFITDRSASETLKKNKRVIIEAEKRYVSRIPLVKMEFKHRIICRVTLQRKTINTCTTTSFSWIYFVHSSFT